VRLIYTIVVLVTFALVLLVGCAAPPVMDLAWHQPVAGTPGSTPTAGPFAPAAGQSTPVLPAAGRSVASLPAVPPRSDPRPARVPVDPALAGYLAQLPAFAPAPVAAPIEVPVGPAVPVYKRLPVAQPVAFLTMDDGWTQLPDAVPFMRAAHVPFTMFLLAPVAARSPAFFTELESVGGVVENHTISHPELRGRGYGYQRHEICDARTSLIRSFGRVPALFRPPYGDYDATTLRVAHDCGVKAALYWSETIDAGKVYYQTSVHRIRPGDIILMHFRPTFFQDVIAALNAIHDAGLTPALLEDYLT
jgi:peptidoglycan/xylan/chitin deacetylase (PgdA/CDA1 family)